MFMTLIAAVISFWITIPLVFLNRYRVFLKNESVQASEAVRKG